MENGNGGQTGRLLVLLVCSILAMYFAGQYMTAMLDSASEDTKVIEEESTEETDTESASVTEETPKPRFETVMKEGDFSVILDTETGVEYLLYESGYGAGHQATMCVLEKGVEVQE